ncbi:hypothetical protein ACJX0J_021979 [Zea mays]
MRLQATFDTEEQQQGTFCLVFIYYAWSGVKKLDAIRSKFFWQGEEGKRNMASVIHSLQHFSAYRLEQVAGNQMYKFHLPSSLIISNQYRPSLVTLACLENNVYFKTVPKECLTVCMGILEGENL